MNQRTTEAAEAAIRLPGARDASYTAAEGEQGEAMTSVETERRAGRAQPRREPVARAERIQIAMFAGLVAIFAAMLAAGALGFTAISGQLLDMQKQIGGLSERITRVEERIIRVEEGIIRVEDRIIRVEERITSVEERITSVEKLIQTHLVPRSAVPPAAGP